MVHGICKEKNTSHDFVHFLGQLVDELTKDKEIHLIMDNYATYKIALVKEWFDIHLRFHFHFIATSSSWLNLVERWFRELRDKFVRRDAFNSVNVWLINYIYLLS
ncbi:MAG: transposase [Deltaproteobacteria bacterium]|nr:transposase [Deltaproteobacteria bacterium]